MRKIPKKKTNKKSSAPLVAMVCKDHEDYRGSYPPKTDCLVCWKIYAARLRFTVKMLKNDLERLRKELKDDLKGLREGLKNGRNG